ncbi:MAG: TIM barrel protein [Rubrivivax sp.]|nr:TIM barrel protein [Rubrivivax sp.]
MQWSTSVSMMFREHAVAQRLKAARDAGFDGVEIQMLAEAPADVWVQARETAGIAVALLNVDMGGFLGGGAGLSGVPGREEAFRTAALAALDTATRLGCRHVHVGPSRVPEGGDRQACLDTLVANLHWLAPRAQASGIRLLLEPLNRTETPTALLGHLDDAVALLEGPLADLAALQFDVYHVAMNGEDPVAALQRMRPHVAHVQFSDLPGRKPPGTGTLDFVRFFQALKRSGYDGWCGAEYLAPTGAAATLGWWPELRAAAA